jgi:hypothetical protein
LRFFTPFAKIAEAKLNCIIQCVASQKSYTVDFLTKKKKFNEGEIPQYYVKNNHQAIIAPEVFEMVQRELERRGKGRGSHSGVHLFSGRIQCGQCGNWYGSKVWHSTSKYRRTIWRCNHKFANDEICTTPHLTDEEIQGYYLSALRKLLADKDEIITAFEQAKDAAFDLSALTAEGNELQNDLLVVSELMHQSMYENARVALDQAEYKKNYGSLTERYEKAKARLEVVKEVISDKQMRQATIEAFLDELKRLDGVTEFQPALWYGLADHMTVYSKEDVRVTFKDGTGISLQGQETDTPYQRDIPM